MEIIWINIQFYMKYRLEITTVSRKKRNRFNKLKPERIRKIPGFTPQPTCMGVEHCEIREGGATLLQLTRILRNLCINWYFDA